MFKRMSVLVRRPGDDRRYFSRNWEAHAAPVSGLPKIRGYIQNHIEEDFSGAAAPIEADGFVELLWDRPEDMAAAFSSPAARPMVEDEPGFLGHGSGYALTAAAPLLHAENGKLIVAVCGAAAAATAQLKAVIEAQDGLRQSIWDEVATMIPKPGMAPPQPVDAFGHLYFESDGHACAGAARIVSEARALGLRLGVYRVRTLRFI